MPCTRSIRQRPHFEPIALPIRPLMPLGECGKACMAATCSPSQSATTTGKAVERNQRASSHFNADEIVRGLFLGTSADAARLEDLESHAIRNVLNVAMECDFSDELLQAQARGCMKLKKVHMVDHSDHDIAKGFPECCEFILQALQKGEGVLVHCRMGVSRSAAIVIAFLMRYGGVYFPAKQRSCEARMRDAAIASLSPEMMSTFPHRVSNDNIMHNQEGKASAAPSASGAPAPHAELLKGADKTRMYPMTYSDAFDVVKEHRHEIAPNLGFCLALREIDVERGILEDLWDFSAAASV